MHFPDILSYIRACLFVLRHGFSRDWYWSFYSTAAKKMYKPFRYYKNHLHGYPCQDIFKNSPYPEINDFFNYCTQEDWEEPSNTKTSDAAQKAWNWVLDEIEFAMRFEYDDEELDYVERDNPNYDKDHTEIIDKLLQKNYSFEAWREAFADPRYGKKKYDRETSQANTQRAMRGFELMGKYWMNLWD